VNWGASGASAGPGRPLQIPARLRLNCGIPASIPCASRRDTFSGQEAAPHFIAVGIRALPSFFQNQGRQKKENARNADKIEEIAQSQNAVRNGRLTFPVSDVGAYHIVLFFIYSYTNILTQNYFLNIRILFFHIPFYPYNFMRTDLSRLSFYTLYIPPCKRTFLVVMQKV
jgi:hypothetical protein